MASLNALSRYQRILLMALAALVLVFSVVYPLTIRREGFLYEDALLLPIEENGSMTYRGKLRGEAAQFTVTPEKAVTFRWGSKTYGPYTLREDPTAIPENTDLPMRGLELRCGGEVCFRGGLVEQGEMRLFYPEGENPEIFVYTTMGDGTTVDGEGNLIDPMEPSILTILTLIDGPELTHKGNWAFFGCGLLLALAAAANILFADALFRFRLSMRIQNPEGVEPSALALADRHIGWTMLTAAVLVVFLLGLR